MQLRHGERWRRTLELRQPRTVRLDRLRTDGCRLQSEVPDPLRVVRRHGSATELHLRHARIAWNLGVCIDGRIVRRRMRVTIDVCRASLGTGVPWTF